jgi:hypothetical protein
VPENGTPLNAIVCVFVSFRYISCYVLPLYFPKRIRYVPLVNGNMFIFSDPKENVLEGVGLHCIFFYPTLLLIPHF